LRGEVPFFTVFGWRYLSERSLLCREGREGEGSRDNFLVFLIVVE